jgi:anti-sigma regulatory factor (Ser/Thr protein kinase)
MLPNLADALICEQYQLSIPSQLDWIEPTVQYLTNRALQCGAVRESRVGRLMLALNEALTNAVIHGNLDLSSDLREQNGQAFADAVAERCRDARYATRRVDIRVSCDPGAVRWMFTDEGRGFDVERVMRRLAEDDNLERASGRGLMIMQAFVDHLRFEEGGRRVVLALDRANGQEKRVSPRPIHRNGRSDSDAGHCAVANQVSALIGQLNARISAGAERRKAPRVVYTACILVEPSSESGSSVAFARNLSHTGIAFVTTAPLPLGVVRLTLPETEGRPPVRMAVQVVHCTPLLQGFYDIGARFIEE